MPAGLTDRAQTKRLAGNEFIRKRLRDTNSGTGGTRTVATLPPAFSMP